MTVRDHMLLTLAASRYAYPAVRDRHISEQVGLSPVRAYQRLVWLLGQREAEGARPVEVRRLRRLVEARRGVR